MTTQSQPVMVGELLVSTKTPTTSLLVMTLLLTMADDVAISKA